MIYFFGFPFLLYLPLILPIVLILVARYVKNSVVTIISYVLTSISLVLILAIGAYAKSAISITDRVELNDRDFVVIRYGSTLSKSTVYVEEREVYLFMEIAKRLYSGIEEPLFLEKQGTTLIVRVHNEAGPKVFEIF